jgi:hypothetical protein
MAWTLQDFRSRAYSFRLPHGEIPYLSILYRPCAYCRAPFFHQIVDGILEDRAGDKNIGTTKQVAY